MSKDLQPKDILSEKFRQYLYSHKDVDKAVEIGRDALANGTLNTIDDGANLLCQLAPIETGTTTINIQTIKDLFAILIQSGASYQINSKSERISLSVGNPTPLVWSITFGASTTFRLLMECPTIDLNATAYDVNWTPLMAAVQNHRVEMAQALCKRFYEIDFHILSHPTTLKFLFNGIPHDISQTALSATYQHVPIADLIKTAVNVDMPVYKQSVNNLLLSCFPKVLISIIGLYAFFN